METDVENGITEMGIVNWRQAVQDMDGWARSTGRGGSAFPSCILEPQRRKYIKCIANPSCGSKVVIYEGRQRWRI
jgi:hypothetical protein